jgi:putative ABC transport system ATP-binding protein
VPDAAISVRDLVLQFGSGGGAARALAGATADVPRGSFTLVRGPSGSGKTSLLSVMGCLLTPQGGSVHLLGEDVTRLDERARATWRRDRIGYVFQSARLLNALTAMENVVLGLEVAGWSRRRARDAAADALASVGLAGKAGLRGEALSGGERQRVSIARALAKAPALVLADEPTAALDSANGIAIADLLRRVADSGTHTVVVVSHDERLGAYADHEVTMADGRVVACGVGRRAESIPARTLD